MNRVILNGINKLTQEKGFQNAWNTQAIDT